MTCPLCKMELGPKEKLTFQLEEVEDGSEQLQVYHHKNNSWCWCCGSVPEEEGR